MIVAASQPSDSLPPGSQRSIAAQFLVEATTPKGHAPQHIPGVAAVRVSLVD